jgi:hypothetical protein
MLQLRCVVLDQVLRLVEPLFDQIVGHPRFAKCRKAKAAKGVKSAPLPCSMQNL